MARRNEIRPIIKLRSTAGGQLTPDDRPDRARPSRPPSIES